MTEREKYYTLLGLVCEKFPYYAAQSAGKAGVGIASRLQNIKLGRIVDLPALVALVRHSLSDFKIPEHLLPEVAEQEVTA